MSRRRARASAWRWSISTWARCRCWTCSPSSAEGGKSTGGSRAGSCPDGVAGATTGVGLLRVFMDRILLGATDRSILPSWQPLAFLPMGIPPPCTEEKALSFTLVGLVLRKNAPLLALTAALGFGGPVRQPLPAP